MAPAQEFSSPGAHMASLSHNDVSGSVAYRNPNKPSVINTSQINNSFDNFSDESNIFHSAKSYSDRVYDFNRQYMDYNDRLFNSAMDYDRYMSNTAIQRQVADLKAAGLNPILAAHLGGAVYKGVNAPYMSLSPGSALSAFTNYDSSIYGSDVGSMTQLEVAKIQSSSQQAISQFNKVMDRIINGDNITANKEMLHLKFTFDKYLENLNYLHEGQLNQFGFQNQRQLISFEKKLDSDYKEWAANPDSEQGKLAREQLMNNIYVSLIQGGFQTVKGYMDSTSKIGAAMIPFLF